MQNFDTWDPYGRAIREGEVPLSRAYRPSATERLIRELVLQLKLGKIRPSYFADKYGVDVRARFADAWASLSRDGWLAPSAGDEIALTRDGLMRVDVLLQRFFLPEHSGIRYT
jgi:oxygen-independent coproporphyrinogen-3 oxidase